MNRLLKVLGCCVSMRPREGLALSTTVEILAPYLSLHHGVQGGPAIFQRQSLLDQTVELESIPLADIAAPTSLNDTCRCRVKLKSVTDI